MSYHATACYNCMTGRGPCESSTDCKADYERRHPIDPNWRATACYMCNQGRGPCPNSPTCKESTRR